MSSISNMKLSHSWSLSLIWEVLPGLKESLLYHLQTGDLEQLTMWWYATPHVPCLNVNHSIFRSAKTYIYPKSEECKYGPFWMSFPCALLQQSWTHICTRGQTRIPISNVYIYMYLHIYIYMQLYTIISSWWFQPNWKILVKLDLLLRKGWTYKIFETNTYICVYIYTWKYMLSVYTKAHKLDQIRYIFRSCNMYSWSWHDMNSCSFLRSMSQHH